MSAKQEIGVVGAGNWGTTLAKILADNGNEVLVWAYEPEVVADLNDNCRNERYLPGVQLEGKLRASTDLEEICRCCRLMLMVVPSHVFRRVARQMGEFLDGEHMIVHCTKGIEQESLKRMSEVIREETCVRRLGVLCGPNLAKELSARQPAGTLVASRYQQVVRAAQQVLHNSYFRVYGGSDVVGAEVGGAFKNIVAVAAGMVDGLKLGDNTKALLLTRGLSEMARFGAAHGADLMTFGGMAGIGDLMATCASPHSRNHQVGERLAQGESLEAIQESMFMVAEGVKTARSVNAYAKYRGLELPIAQAVYQILYEKISVEQAMELLMAVEVDQEFLDLRALR